MVATAGNDKRGPEWYAAYAAVTAADYAERKKRVGLKGALHAGHANRRERVVLKSMLLELPLS